MKAPGTMRLSLLAAAVMIAIGAIWADDAPTARKRRVTPVNTAASQTQSVNETRDDTSRINAAFRARSEATRRDDGTILFIDTVTGEQWIDSSAMIKLPRMKYPLLVDATVSVDIWNAAMRLFGQKHGLVGFSADVNMHNRYFPSFEFGLGKANNTPADEDYTYSSPMSVYFKLGADYNFLYNSNPDYKWFVGVRYGFSPFKWNLTNVHPAPGYWGDTPGFDLLSQTASAGWFEFNVGLRVKLWKNISAGWRIIVHTVMHESKNEHGKPWYIPGYGSRSGLLTGSFSVSYTVPLKGRNSVAFDTVPGTTSPVITDSTDYFPPENPQDTIFQPV